MIYKIFKQDDHYLIAVEGVKDGSSTETAFRLEATGDYSLLKNSVNMCEDIIYKELNKDKRID